MTTEQRDTLAKKWFPKEWETALAPGKSKRRREIRKDAEALEIRDGFVKAGETCKTCRCFETTLSFHGPRTYCVLDSDWYGFALAAGTGCCERWKRR